MQAQHAETPVSTLYYSLSFAGAAPEITTLGEFACAEEARAHHAQNSHEGAHLLSAADIEALWLTMPLPQFKQDPLSHQRMHQFAERLSDGVKMLRTQPDVFFTINAGPEVEIDLESESDRVIIYRENHGYTSVSYTSEGLLVDVHQEGPNGTLLQTLAIGHDELQDPEVDMPVVQAGSLPSAMEAPQAVTPPLAKPILCIQLEGSVIHQAITNDPRLQHVEVIIADEDTESGGSNLLTELYDTEGNSLGSRYCTTLVPVMDHSLDLERLSKDAHQSQDAKDGEETLQDTMGA